MKQQVLLALINKYLNGTASEEDRELLQQYFNSFQQTETWNEAELGDRDETEARMLNRLSAALQQQQEAVAVPVYRWHWLKMAAVFLLVCGSATMLWQINRETAEPFAVKEEPHPVQTATANSATLTLPDGTVVVLDHTPDGVLASHQNTLIRKQGTNITIDAGVPLTNTTANAAGLHTLKTSNGKQYKAVLADGSQVWLNAASSLRFPSSFSGDERKVEVDGEAYFDVAKDTAKPFRVLAITEGANEKRGTLIEVVGTQFNISAYRDEGVIKTTLLQGSVRVAAMQNGFPVKANMPVLRPGEQAQITTGDTEESINIGRVDVEEAVAWKSNLFYFNNTGLQSIMRQLARWYDVEVVYNDKVPVRHFSGKISRAAPLSTVLEILEQSNIHFTIRGKQIIVKS